MKKREREKVRQKGYSVTFTGVRKEVWKWPVAQNTLTKSTITNYNNSNNKHNDAENAWSPLKEEGNKIENDD